MKIHILGIAGTFMGGVAALARELGHEVEGSDQAVYPPMSTQLERLGIDLRQGYDPGNISADCDIVVVGNALSLNSSPHGAGRSYSRKAARRTFTLRQLREAMAGIEYRDTEAFLDEIPAAYKPIDQVMADSADLVSVRHTLRQIVNVKGD